MSRSSRAKARSQTESSPLKPRHTADSPSSKPVSPSGDASAAVSRFTRIDAAMLALLLGFAMLLIASTGLGNGQELWPMPDAVEYAATAVNLDRGSGPVLHF